MNELNNFFLGVQQVAQDAVDKAPYDRTFRGVIEEINDDGTCNVRINGRTYENIKLPQEYHFDYSQPWDGDLNVLGNFAIQNNTMVDYIVEQGTSNPWTYRKWSSGIAECWGTLTYQSPISSVYGSIYYVYTPERNFPASLFISTPKILATSRIQGMLWVSTRTATKDTATYYLYYPISHSGAEWTFDVHAIGRWK